MSVQNEMNVTEPYDLLRLAHAMQIYRVIRLQSMFRVTFMDNYLPQLSAG